VSALAARLRGIPSWQATLGVALFVLGFLIAAQLQTEAPRVRYSSQERPPLIDTARSLQAVRDQLQARILELRTQVEQAEQGAVGNDVLVRQLNEQLRQARIGAGLVEMVGPGVVVELNDSPGPVPPDAAPDDYLASAEDVRDLVTELWLAGAQAISINGERIGVTTALTDLGTSLLVNSAYLQPPYEISAIGPRGLEDRLTGAAGFETFLRERSEPFGIAVAIAVSEQVVVPAYAGTISVSETRPAPPTPAP
jgi:uncharacterized protein YlxW (UPF0749 family)